MNASNLHALARIQSDALCRSLTRLEAAGNRLDGAIPAQEPDADALALSAAHLEGIAAELLKLGSECASAAAVLSTLSSVARELPPEPSAQKVKRRAR